MKKILVSLMACTLLSFSLEAQNALLQPLTRDNTKEVVIDPNTKLMWQDDVAAKTVEKNWQDATEFCRNLSLDGKNDWRLPTIEELMSIIEDTKVEPAILEGFKNVANYPYWSSSSDVSELPSFKDLY